MKKVKAGSLKDGQKFKRTARGVWFSVITKGPFGVVATSTVSDYSVLLKKGTTVLV